MAYQSLYRKYRSQSFDDLIGQGHVVRTLQSGIERGRIAHAYLFTGPRGTGKTSTARLLAKALCCENGPTAHPDGDCEICREITAGSCVDVLELDAASESGVDDIRQAVVETVEYKPVVARYKVFIIDEVHDLSTKAFDALLKTIEEPPEHVIFILATTEYHKVPATIRSRCQKYEFHRASMSDLSGRLRYVAEAEGVTVEPEAISAIARMADGGFRDALTLLEQAILTSIDGRVTLAQVYDQLGLVGEETVDAILMAVRNGDVAEIMNQLAAIAQLGRDPRALLDSAMHRLADLTRAAYGVAIGADDAAREASLHEAAARLGKDQVLRLRGAIAKLHEAIRDVTLPRLWLESELVRLSQGPQTVAAAPVAVRPTPAAAALAERPVAPAPTPVAPTPAPIAEPVAATPPPPVVAAPAGTGNPDLDRAVTAWAATQSALSSQSSLMAMKLKDSAVAQVESHVVTIQMERQMDLDWVQTGAKRAPAILECFRTQYALATAELRYMVKRKDVPDSAEAVEIPVDGSRLDQLIRETFGDGPAIDPPSA